MPRRKTYPKPSLWAQAKAKILPRLQRKTPLPSAKPVGRRDDRIGLSEEAARGLAEQDARLPPPGVETQPASAPVPFRKTKRLAKSESAGGGMVTRDDGKQVPHYWGHRQRLRTRFLEGGHQAMPEYELLELLLFNAIPKIDVKPLAKRLLAEFGDLNGVVAAPKDRLINVQGSNDRVYLQLRICEAFAHKMARAQVMQRDVISSWEDLMTYCKTVMAHRDTEQMRVLYLDNKNVLIADEAQATGTINHVPFYPREVCKRALELNAAAIILVHNHPSGDPTPSQADIQMTENLQFATGPLGLTVHDHVVIGKEDDVSFRSMGLLD